MNDHNLLVPQYVENACNLALQCQLLVMSKREAQGGPMAPMPLTFGHFTWKCIKIPQTYFKCFNQVLLEQIKRMAGYNTIHAYCIVLYCLVKSLI